MWRCLAVVCGLCSLFAQVRLIPHLTAPNGGFKTSVIVQNELRSSTSYRLQPYAADGSALTPVEGEIGGRGQIALDATELFTNANVSHLVVEGDDVTVSVSYQVASGRGSPAHVIESSVQLKNWRIFAGNWALVFDGFAVINAGSQATDIAVKQVANDGVVIQELTAVADLQPWQKGLFVLGGPQGSEFIETQGAHFEIVASEPIALTALRGTPPGTPVGYLWENEANLPLDAQNSILIPHITRAGGGFATRIVIENSGNSPKSVTLRPFSQDGTPLQPIERLVAGFVSEFHGAVELLGAEASHVVVEGPSAIRVSAEYTAQGSGSPVQVRSTSLSEGYYRLQVGNWDEVFDGVALVNLDDHQADVFLEQFDDDGQSLGCEWIAEGLTPMAKSLFVIGGPSGSDFVPGGYFNLSSTAEIAVTALRGTAPGSNVNYLWSNASHPIDAPIAACSETTGAQVSGYLADNGTSTLLLAEPEDLPSGFEFLAGAQVDVLTRDEEVLAGLTTDSGGFFTVSGLPLGLLDVRGMGSALVQAYVTAVPGHEVRVNPLVAVSRAAAVDLALAGLPNEALVLGSMQPLPVGTPIYPKYGADDRGSRPADVTVLDQSSWLFYVDLEPFLMMTHPTQWVLVDAESGQLTRRSAESPLIIGHQNYWDSDRDGLLARGFDLDMPFDPLNLPAGAELLISPELVRGPSELLSSTRAAKSIAKGSGNENVFGIAFSGSDAINFDQDRVRMRRWMLDQGVPEDQIITFGSANESAPGVRQNTTYDNYFNAYNNQIMQLPPDCDATLLVYFSTHGHTDGQWDMQFEGEEDPCLWFGSRLKLAQSKAKKIRVVIDSCYSEKMIQSIKTSLQASSEGQQKDVELISAACADQYSYAITAILSALLVGPLQPEVGGLFTQHFVEHVTLEEGDLTNAYTMDESGNASANPELDTVTANAKVIVCKPGTVTEGDAISVGDVPTGTFTRLCVDQEINCVTVTNQSNSPYQYQASVGHVRTYVVPPSFTLAPGGSQKVCIRWLADPENRFSFGGIEDTLTIVGSSLDPNNPGGASVDVPYTAMQSADRDVFEFLKLLCPDKSDNEIRTFLSMNTRIATILAETINSFGSSAVPDCPEEISQYGAFGKFMLLAQISTLFPKLNPFVCGEESEGGLTVCPTNRLPLEEGEYFMVYLVTREPIPLNHPENRYQFGFVFDTDNNPNNNFVPASSFPFDLFSDTDRWYSVEYSAALGWRMVVTDARNSNPTSVASAARAVIRDNSLILWVPRNEFVVDSPAYRVTAYRHTGDFGRNDPWSGDLHPPVGEPLNEFGDRVP